MIDAWERPHPLVIFLPSVGTQRRIAEYLDRETARIDALIAAKERLLDLLAEKRRALITHTVTRGLNRAVHLRDSGLPWLGRIPEHWEVVQQKRAWASAEYGLSESIREEGAIAVLRMSCITPEGGVDFEQAGQIDDVSNELLLRKGDLLFNRTNSLDQIAKVGLVECDPDRETSFASYLVRIRTNDRAAADFLIYLLNSQDFLAFARGQAIPAIGQANLNPSRYGDLHIPLPPINEQKEIAAFIKDHHQSYARSAEKLRLSLALLRERRSALIAAAVTGQLPVEG
jgi:type I restriction enzyme S subunit